MSIRLGRRCQLGFNGDTVVRRFMSQERPFNGAGSRGLFQREFSSSPFFSSCELQPLEVWCLLVGFRQYCPRREDLRRANDTPPS